MSVSKLVTARPDYESGQGVTVSGSANKRYTDQILVRIKHTVQHSQSRSQGGMKKLIAQLFISCPPDLRNLRLQHIGDHFWYSVSTSTIFSKA
jgi:hypothetical protein